jgi:hypothetical protein
MPKSVTRTVRLDDDLDKAIQNRAKDSNVSVNFLVNKLIRKFVDWDIPAEKLGIVHVPAVLFKRLFDSFDDDAAEGLGRWLAHEHYDPFFKYVFGELTFEKTVDHFRMGSEYGGRFSFAINSDERNHTIVIKHNAGMKFSRFYAGLLKGVYTDILTMDLKVECTADLCLAHLVVARADHPPTAVETGNPRKSTLRVGA